MSESEQPEMAGASTASEQDDAAKPPPRTSSAAIASLMLGILALEFPLLGLVALIAGLRGIAETSNPWRITGRRVALAGMLVGVVGFLPFGAQLYGTFMESYRTARELTQQTVSESNLRAIHEAMERWAAAHDGRFPESLGTLVAESSLGPKAVTNPRMGDGSPPSDASSDDLAVWANRNSDYVLIQSHQRMDDVPPDAPLIYEKIQPSIREGITICFGDGDVRFIDWPEAREILREAGEDVPDTLPDG